MEVVQETFIDLDKLKADSFRFEELSAFVFKWK